MRIMPTRIHLSHGDPVVVEEDGAAVLEALNNPPGRLAPFKRGEEDQVMVNPDHVVYLDSAIGEAWVSFG
jgi:hypothetical protein